jgi:hypothetical protein
MNAAKTKSLYNLIPTVSWSLACFTPIGYFCYAFMDLLWLYLFLFFSLATLLLPRSFQRWIQLSTKISTYKKIGIRLTKKLTQDGDLVNRSMQRQFPDQKGTVTQNTLARHLARSYFHEKTHVVMFVFFLLTAVYAVFYNFVAWACVITLTNIVFNLYPIFLQQYNRLRIQHIAKRQHTL